MSNIFSSINPMLLGILIVVVLGVIGFTVWWDERRKR
jgi:hypothetical protein